MCGKGFTFELSPDSLNPTLTTPDGVAVRLVSRDCCPYLDDYDQGYTVAAPAVPSTPAQLEKTVSWDQRGPLYDRPSQFENIENSELAKAGPTDLYARPTTGKTQIVDNGWKINPKPRKLIVHGTNEIAHRLQSDKIQWKQ